MTAFPALPLFTDAYMADTRDLTYEQHGVYLHLLMIAWRRPTCSVPDDDKWLCRTLGMQARRWRRHKDDILARFFTLEETENGPEWTQKRLKLERNFAETSRKLSQKSAQTRWAKNKKNKDIGKKSHMPPTQPKGITPKSMTNVGVIPFQHPDSQDVAPGDAKRRRPLAADGQRSSATATENTEPTKSDELDWKNLKAMLAKPVGWQIDDPLDIPPALKRRAAK